MKNTLITIAIAIAALCLGYYVRLKEVKPIPYSSADSIRNAAIDSTKGIYQLKIDSLKKISAKRYIKIIEYRDIADSLSINADVICDPIIEAKDRLIYELDSAIIDCEDKAQTYEKTLLLQEEQTNIELKRFTALSAQMDSAIISYQDSITAINKQSDKAIKKEKRKTLFYKATTTIATTLAIYRIIVK